MVWMTSNPFCAIHCHMIPQLYHEQALVRQACWAVALVSAEKPPHLAESIDVVGFPERVKFA